MVITLQALCEEGQVKIFVLEHVLDLMASCTGNNGSSKCADCASPELGSFTASCNFCAYHASESCAHEGECGQEL